MVYPPAETVNHHLTGAEEFSTGDMGNFQPALTKSIYNTLRSNLERTNFGRFLAINVETSTYEIGDTPDEALKNARRADPSGAFHLKRIGLLGSRER
jgi:hypothetical protein